MRTLTWLAGVLAAGLAAGAAAEDQTSVCRAIAATRVSALQPKDRLFFAENCVCFDYHRYKSDYDCVDKASSDGQRFTKISDCLAAVERAWRAASPEPKITPANWERASRRWKVWSDGLSKEKDACVQNPDPEPIIARIRREPGPKQGRQ